MIGKRAFVPPIQRVDDDADDGDGARFRFHLDEEELALVVRLLGELKELLTSEVDERTAPLLHRLFPPAFHDDPDKEAEYQRLMREELVTSRVAAVDEITALLTGDGAASVVAGATLSEGETMAFMRSLNAIRLILGTMLDITDEESAEVADMNDSPEHSLYAYLGWLLEWTVRALGGV